MRPKPPSRGVLELDHETVQRIGWVLAALLFALAIVSFVGEIRGWWGFFGEIGMVVGTIGGLFISFTNLLLGADGKSQRVVHQAVLDASEGVQGTQEAVRDTHEAVQENGRTLVSVDRKLDKLDELDVIQAQLDTQTGTLDRQLRVLEQIRDA